MTSVYAAYWSPEIIDEEALESLAAALSPWSYGEARGALSELQAIHSTHPSVLEVMARCGAVRRRGGLKGALGTVPDRLSHRHFLDLSREALAKTNTRGDRALSADDEQPSEMFA
jgi:hypothetical protein